jgi:hypothetical protein
MGQSICPVAHISGLTVREVVKKAQPTMEKLSRAGGLLSSEHKEKCSGLHSGPNKSGLCPYAQLTREIFHMHAVGVHTHRDTHR